MNDDSNLHWCCRPEAEVVAQSKRLVDRVFRRVNNSNLPQIEEESPPANFYDQDSGVYHRRCAYCDRVIVYLNANCQSVASQTCNMQRDMPTQTETEQPPKEPEPQPAPSSGSNCGNTKCRLVKALLLVISVLHGGYALYKFLPNMLPYVQQANLALAQGLNLLPPLQQSPPPPPSPPATRSLPMFLWGLLVKCTEF
ncbi:maker343 [Drosophila busckii]|uniref:Maker343 n=1 Tax=Drosophila busckii TaxID=30019 RepID=A0A0M3QZJ8_DROBS|nr:uncharacterized protein LOC108606018 [Drosophila busckii]ALC49543.1 maker343 [Drosophila busckii]